jgi:hypothetical protein
MRQQLTRLAPWRKMELFNPFVLSVRDHCRAFGNEKAAPSPEAAFVCFTL